MSANLTPTWDNPYSSTEENPVPAAPLFVRASSEGSAMLILIGVVLLLGGYITSNVFLIGDLYHIGVRADGVFVPSPLAPVFKSPSQQWAAYGVGALAVVIGSILVGSQAFNPLMGACYFLCPLAGVTFLVGAPLRLSCRLALPMAALYLAVGTCLAGAGSLYVYHEYGKYDGNIWPIAASMVAQAGAALAAGGIFKLLTIAE